MTDSRVLRYRASTPKVLLLLIGSAALTAVGWRARTPGAVIDWVMIGFLGLVTLGMLTALVFAVVRRKPVLAISSTGLTYFPPGRSPNVTVPWDDVAHIGIDAQEGMRGLKSYYLAVQARHPDRYTSPHQRAMIIWHSAGQDVVMAVPLDLLFFWPSRTRRAQMLERIKTTFAPEIIQYGVEVDEKEHTV